MKLSIFVSRFVYIVLFVANVVLLPKKEICPSGAFPEHEHIKPGKVVAGYFLGWTIDLNGYKPHKVDPIAEKLTHLMYSFYKPLEDGTGSFMKPELEFDINENTESGKAGGNFAELVQLKKDHPHLKLMIAVGGGSFNKVFMRLQKKGLLKKYARSCVDALDQYEHVIESNGKKATLTYQGLFDGIDVDWELSPSKISKKVAQDYLMFVKELRRLLDQRAERIGQPTVLTAALQLGRSVYRKLPLKEVARYIDWYHVMGYDVNTFGSGEVGYNAPICGNRKHFTIDGALNGIMREGVLPSQLVLVVPFYGRQYDEADEVGDSFDRASKDTRTMPFYKIDAILEKQSKDIVVGDDSKRLSSFLIDKKKDSFLVYDDAQDIGFKARYAAENRCRGVGAWALSYDDKEHELVHALSDYVGKKMFE